MTFLASLFAALIPMLAYLVIIWQLDKYEREPFKFVLKHFLWGAIGAIIFGLLFSTLLISGMSLISLQSKIIEFSSAVIVAPIVEEIVKSIYLFRSYKKNYFDNITDGLVYGGAIGLGFGMTENLMYFITYDETFSQWITLVITRSIFSAVMHAIATATVGAFLAKAKFSLTNTRYNLPFWGILLAILFHATWNFSLSFDFTYYLGIIFMILLIYSFLIIFKSSIKNEKKIINSELQNDVFLQKLNKDNNSEFVFNDIINFVTNKKDKKRLNLLSTKLAFRKFQSKNSLGKQQEHYISEVELYRNEINKLVNQYPINKGV